MARPGMNFEFAQRVADAVLWEGYVLYPYRASAVKNRFRWQFGVVVPKAYGELSGEPWSMQTECLIEPGQNPVVHARVRFLQVQARTVEQAVGKSGKRFRPVERLEVEGRELVTWEEGIERVLDLPTLRLPQLQEREPVIPFEFEAVRELESIMDRSGRVRARVVRERRPISATARLSAAQAGKLVRLRVLLENLTPWSPREGPQRASALRQAMNGTHILLEVHGGMFVSLLDPPDWAAEEAAACVNRHTWPVLVGEPESRVVMLSSPIILYDYPTIAPESPGDLFDATEIDEILTLRIMTLSDEEKREARSTDERARQVIDRTETLPAEVLQRLHGAIRQLEVVGLKGTGDGEDDPGHSR